MLKFTAQHTLYKKFFTCMISKRTNTTPRVKEGEIERRTIGFLQFCFSQTYKYNIVYCTIYNMPYTTTAFLSEIYPLQHSCLNTGPYGRRIRKWLTLSSGPHQLKVLPCYLNSTSVAPPFYLFFSSRTQTLQCINDPHKPLW